MATTLSGRDACVLMHTALRKVCDSSATSAAQLSNKRHMLAWDGTRWSSANKQSQGRRYQTNPCGSRARLIHGLAHGILSALFGEHVRPPHRIRPARPRARREPTLACFLLENARHVRAHAGSPATRPNDGPQGPERDHLKEMLTMVKKAKKSPSTRPVTKSKDQRKFCSFPGCSGGCHFCWSVRDQRANRPLYEAAQRVLAGRPTKDVRLIAEHVARQAAPMIDKKTWRWL